LGRPKVLGWREGMLGEKTIFSNNYWCKQFGLYPMLMNPHSRDNKYLMLNGGNKDFCLQHTNFIEDKSDNFFSESWSTNTKNFVAFIGDYVYVYNWLNGKPSKHPKQQVEESPDKFYVYLSSQSYKTPDDAIPYIIGIFRELRNFTGDQEPEKALNLLFRLLICIDPNEDYTKIDSFKWGINSNIYLPVEFDHYVDRMRKVINSILPKRDLILRHVAGALFQEAHKEVIYFDSQRDLFGDYSNKLITKNDTYSSVHYTPSYLARTIVENCLEQLDWRSKDNINIFDPACGSSEFLIETLKQLQNLGYNGKIKIEGWDTSPSAVCTSNFLLKYEQQTQWNNATLNFKIKQVLNSLTEQWDKDYDLIVMNPPFVSWELLKEKNSRNAVLDTLGSSYERKRPNIASAFFYKAVKSLSNNGVIGCILPYSILTSDDYTKIRQEVRDEININLAAKLGNYVFEDALTDVCFVIGTKGKSKVSPKLIWCKNEKYAAQESLIDLRKMEANNQQAVEKNNYCIYSSPQFLSYTHNWKVIPRKSSIFKQNLSRFIFDKKLQPIMDIFTINQGALSGIKNIFIIKKEKYSDLPENEKKYFRPVITNKTIKCGHLEEPDYIWFPYNANGITIKNEAELESISFAKETLIVNKEILAKRKGIKEWWGLTRPRNWQFKKEKRLYSNRFGNSDSFAIDTKGNCVIEEGNAFIPIKELKNDDFYFYLSIFSSDIFDLLLSIYCKQLAGGNWYDLGAKHTKNIPIPNVHIRDVRETEPYSRLVELGMELTNGNSYVKHAISDVVKLYYPEI
jgi:type I restriction-modification system DNA methylase subunit